MKRFVCTVCLLALLLSACSVAEQTPTIPEGDYSYGIYQLTFKTKQISNDCVGNNWSFTYTHNGQTIKSGYTITQSLEVFTFQSIGVEVREKDKIEDVGTGMLTVAICEVGSGKTTITVTETDGRYKGNTAVWEISCEVELVGKKGTPRFFTGGSFLWLWRQDSIYIFALDENRGSHQFLNWWQQHPTGVLLPSEQ